MEIKIVTKPIKENEISQIAEKQFGNLVKFVVDINKKIIAIGGEMHSDEEALLIEKGSNQTDLWGINYHIGNAKDEKIEFDSMINLRPSSGNRSRGVEDPDIRKRIIEIVEDLIEA